MKILVIGPPDSGKSLLAEELAMKTGCRIKYYLATMQVMDPDGAARVIRHRRQRDGKGFITIERGLDLPGVLGELRDAGDAVVLLECVSNLVGNEMHSRPTGSTCDRTSYGSGDQLAEEITQDIMKLAERVRDLIIVTSEFEKDGDGYDEDTESYVELLDLVNEKLMRLSDEIHDLRRC